MLFRIPGQAITAVAASPDGALFVATTEGVYRHVPAPGPTFERLMPAPSEFRQQLAAPSRRVVYYIVNGRDVREAIAFCGLSHSLLLLAAGSLSAQGSLDREGGRVVILPDSAMPHVLTQCSRGAPRGVSGFWRPTPADVAAAEDAVDRALARALDSVIARDGVGETKWLGGPRAAWPDQYYRQYAGLRYRDGRRTIYVNGLAAGWPRELSERLPRDEATSAHPFANPEWWRFNVATVCNGGESFFGVEYDPLTKRVLSFQFNGRASTGSEPRFSQP